jgi:hypothetical protein
MAVTFRVPPRTPKIVVTILKYHQERVFEWIRETLPLDSESDILTKMQMLWFVKDDKINHPQWIASKNRVKLNYFYLTKILQKIMAEHIQNDVVTRLSVRTLENGTHIIGVYAIRDIPAGTYPFKTLLGHCFAEEPTIKILKDSPEVQDVRAFLDEFFLGDTTSYMLPALGPNSINVGYFLNHSEEPNIRHVQVPGCTYSVYQTTRAIRRGEELTIDYNDFVSRELPFQAIQKQLDPHGLYLKPRPKTAATRKRHASTELQR